MQAVKRPEASSGLCCLYPEPLHTNEHYLETALRLQEIGADSICIKDMAGMISPIRLMNW